MNVIEQCTGEVGSVLKEKQKTVPGISRSYSPGEQSIYVGILKSWNWTHFAITFLHAEGNIQVFCLISNFLISALVFYLCV